MNQLIKIEKMADVSLSVTPEAIQERDSLITELKDVTAVSNSFDLACATDRLRKAKALTNSVEKTRKEIKAPVIDLGKRIDKLADEYTASVNAEVVRINGMVSAYQAEQVRIQREEEAKRQAEIRRIEEERIKAEREKQAAEQAARAAAALARSEEERLEAAEASAIAARKAKEFEELQKKQAPVPAPAPLKIDGLVTKEEWVFDIINIWDVPRQFLDVSVKTAEIKRAIQSGCREISGLNIRKQISTHVRQ